MKRQHVALFMVLVLIVFGCSPVKKAYFTAHFEDQEAQFQHHSGFVLFDIERDQFIYQHNEDKYFTPASNTKIFTLFGALNIIGDSLPTIEYVENDDSLIFWGTGDPSFLNPKLPHDTSIYHFLKYIDKTLYFSTSNYNEKHLGPGWAWDDYSYSFSAERSPFPIYGNTIEVAKTDSSKSITVNIPYFKPYFHLEDSIADIRSIIRDIDNNVFHYYPYKNEFNYSVPYHYSDVLITELLRDTLKRKVNLIQYDKPYKRNVLYSSAVDSTYRLMMQDSDNFIAEQLLLLCSNVLFDTLNTQQAIHYITDSLLTNIPDIPVWRDGSGLSRYNLLTPRSIVWLWKELYLNIGKDRLFALLAAGGESGTLKNYYKADPPYIYGKTGTMSNNHNLSGFIITKSGRVLVFSYMNNNYPVAAREVKPGMEKLLRKIHEQY